MKNGICIGTNNSNKFISVDHLTPYTRYRISFVVRVNGSSLWSDPAVLYLQTKPTGWFILFVASSIFSLGKKSNGCFHFFS